MDDFFSRNDGLVDVVKFLDSEIKINDISKNTSFRDVIRKDKNFIKNERGEYLSNITNIIDYISNSKIVRQYEAKKKNNITLYLIKKLYDIKFELLKNKIINDNSVDEIKKYFNFNTLDEVIKSLYLELKHIKRDIETNILERNELLRITHKYTFFMCYKVAFTTSRKRFTTARNYLKNSDLEADTLEFALKRFRFPATISDEINSAGNIKVYEQLKNKVEIKRKDIDDFRKYLTSFVDNLNIRLNNDIVVGAKDVIIKRNKLNKVINVEIENKSEIFTKLIQFIILNTGRRPSELIVKPTNILERIEDFKNNFDTNRIVDYNFKEVFLKIINNNNLAIFLNQKKKRNKNIRGFEIPINTTYLRIMKSLLLLRVFVPNRVLKTGELKTADYMLSYVNNDNLKALDIGLENLKDLRSIYAIYNEDKYNRGTIDALVYCQEILGHERNLKDLSTTQHYFKYKLI